MPNASTQAAPSFLERVGTAPISWGICEVPGWGAQLPPERTLAEMASLGLRTTEMGAVGYLPEDPAALRQLLERHGMGLIGGFNALALADPERSAEQLAAADRSAAVLASGGAQFFVSCVVTDPADWRRPGLDDAGWTTMVTNLAEIDRICARHGLVHVFHAHVDSLVETAEEIERLVESSDVAFVLETGHFLIGGYDPLRFVREHRDRIGLVHLKDVRLDLVDDLRTRRLSLMEAVQAGIFPSLGNGGAPIAAVIDELERTGYDGWYVIEQDVALTDGLPAVGEGPIRDVARSVAYLRSIENSIVTDHHHNKGDTPA
jgi:inosose dehydratase